MANGQIGLTNLVFGKALTKIVSFYGYIRYLAYSFFCVGPFVGVYVHFVNSNKLLTLCYIFVVC